MNIDINKAKRFISKLKSLHTNGQDEWPFWYIFQDDFENLDLLIKFYEEKN